MDLYLLLKTMILHKSNNEPPRIEIVTEHGIKDFSFILKETDNLKLILVLSDIWNDIYVSGGEASVIFEMKHEICKYLVGNHNALQLFTFIDALSERRKFLF